MTPPWEQTPPSSRTSLVPHVHVFLSAQSAFVLSQEAKLSTLALPLCACLSARRVLFHPTVPHCTLARNIGLLVLLRLRDSLPAEHKVMVQLAPSSHHDEVSLNRVLNDKERVVAALEIPQVLAQLQALLPPD